MAARLRWTTGLAAAALLGGLAWQSLDGMRDLALTSDEVSHLPAGFAFLTTGEMRLNPQHPPLTKLLAAVPLLALGARMDSGDPGWQPETLDEWGFGHRFLFENQDDPLRLIFWGRAPTLLQSLLAGLVVFAWARSRWGDSAGLLALSLWTLSPSVVAHSQLVTMDVPLAAWSVAAF